MTKAKKVLSFCLAVVMVIGMFAFGAFAAEENATISVTVDQASVKTGDIVNVTVKLTTGYFVGPLQLPIHYDPAVLQYVDSSANPADVFGANGATKTVVSQTNNGCVQFGFVPVTDKGAVSQKLTDYQIVTFQLKAVKDGSSEVALHAADQKSPTNTGGLLYVGSFSSSSVDETANPIGQTLTLNGTTVTVGGTTAVPELTAKVGTTGYVDKNRKFVYGVTAGDDASTYFEATNGGTLEWALGTASAQNGTGATVTLKSADGAIVDTYTLVIFGDVNGDGAATGADSQLIMNKVAGNATLNDLQTFSADLNGDGTATGADSQLIMNKVAGNATLTVNPYIA